MAKATVAGVDDYRWVEDGVILSAGRGEEIDVSAEELARGVELGALEAAGSKKPRGKSDEPTADADEPVADAPSE